MRYLALLRGVNVGGHNKLPMAELRALCGELGWRNVGTYIQSGNVVFDADGSTARVRDDLASGIAERFGFRPAVVLRDVAGLDAAMAANPFTDRDLDPAKLTVTFLAEPVPESVRAAVTVPPGLPEQAAATRTELYVYYPDGMGRSKLDRSPFWKPLAGTVTTTRNWRTVLKLRDMLAAVD
ncbi:uncharacterized protein (DUF1697 family) [Stackebrandtia albiflava]|uniref:Uncharacterized protein (DUF1697 family) n=1 Tax=Stackebrandtia albiflava TaxID=406432 RepID=A0A562VC98_9ACTN|nr:DUF1697 domain-containing protein [Stackebrandtia albiflava]TWJ15504.1 uncharacterized protein (DUF1697 family) [Stackebrandtia albiflava]